MTTKWRKGERVKGDEMKKKENEMKKRRMRRNIKRTRNKETFLNLALYFLINSTIAH